MSARVSPWSVEEAVDVVADVPLDQVRHLGVEDDPQPGAAHVPAHRPLGVRVETAPGGEHPRSGGQRRVPSDTAGDHRRGAVGEEPAGDEVGDRDVVALHGQRAQLDGDQHRDLARVPGQVVVQPGDPRRAGDAAEPHQRDPLDVRPEAEQGGDPGVEGRHREAGHGGRDDQVHVGRGQVGRLERRGQGLRAEPDGLLDEQVVGGAEVVQGGVPVQWQHQVAGPDAGVRVEAPQHQLVDPLAREHRGERVGDLLLRVAELGQHAPDAEDVHVTTFVRRGSGGCLGRAARPPGGRRAGE